MRGIMHALKGIVSNTLMSIASIFSIGATLTILGMALMFVVSANELSESMLKKVDVVTIQVTEDITARESSEIKSNLEKVPNIVDVKFFSKDEVLANFIKTMDESDRELFEGITNRMPNIFELRVDDVNNLPVVKEKLTQLDKDNLFAKIKFEQDLSQKLISISRIVRNVAILVIIALLVITFLIVNNTIRSGIVSRSKEISIMRYVGATRGYIRRPYIVQGIIFGLIGAMISILILYLGTTFVVNMVQKEILLSANIDKTQTLSVLTNIGVLNIIMGVGIGLIGSIMSLRRYLKV